MSTLRFVWYKRKATVNAKEHGVSFEEARSVFFDERARLIADPNHSEYEERYILLGLSSALRLLLVCHPGVKTIWDHLLADCGRRYPHHLRT